MLVGAIAHSGEWSVFEDAFIRFEYPKSWRAVGPLAGEELSKPGYIVLSPESGGLPGPMDIYLTHKATFDTDPNIREKISRDLTGYVKDGWRLLGSTEQMTVPGGRCTLYRVESKQNEACPSGDDPKALCHNLRIQTECSTDSARRVSVTMLLTPYPELGKPAEDTRKQLGIYERFIKSLTFK